MSLAAPHALGCSARFGITLTLGTMAFSGVAHGHNPTDRAGLELLSRQGKETFAKRQVILRGWLEELNKGNLEGISLPSADAATQLFECKGKPPLALFETARVLLAKQTEKLKELQVRRGPDWKTKFDHVTDNYRPLAQHVGERIHPFTDFNCSVTKDFVAYRATGVFAQTLAKTNADGTKASGHSSANITVDMALINARWYLVGVIGGG